MIYSTIITSVTHTLFIVLPRRKQIKQDIIMTLSSKELLLYKYAQTETPVDDSYEPSNASSCSQLVENKEKVHIFFLFELHRKV